MKKNTVLILFLFVLSSCEYWDNRLKITNKSKFDIAIEAENDSIDQQYNNIDFYLENVIKPDSTYSQIQDGKNGWTNYLQRSVEHKLYIYVFPTDTLKKYWGKMTMEELVAKKKYYTKLKFTQPELEKLNWQVTFDPSIKQNK